MPMRSVRLANHAPYLAWNALVFSSSLSSAAHGSQPLDFLSAMKMIRRLPS